MLQQKGIVPPKRTWYPKIQWFVLIFPMNMFEIWGSLGIPHSYPFLNKPRDQSSYQVRGTYLSNVLRVQSGKGLSRDRQGMSVEKVHPQVPQHVQTWRRIDHTCAKMKVTLACPISLVAGLDRDKPYGTNLVPKQRRYSATLVAGCIMLVIWGHPYRSVRNHGSVCLKDCSFQPVNWYMFPICVKLLHWPTKQKDQESLPAKLP